MHNVVLVFQFMGDSRSGQTGVHAPKAVAEVVDIKEGIVLILCQGTVEENVMVILKGNWIAI